MQVVQQNLQRADGNAARATSLSREMARAAVVLVDGVGLRNAAERRDVHLKTSS